MIKGSLRERFIGFLQKIVQGILGILMLFLILALGQCCQEASPFTQRTPTPRPTATTAPTPVPGITGNLVDLIEQGVIEVQPKGSSIEELELFLKRLLDEIIEVEIEIGTYFVAHEGSTQNMVVLEEVVVRLDVDDWIETLLDVACGNMRRDIPGEEDSFDVIRVSDQPELRQLLDSMASTAREGWEYRNYAVRQAAIWIITDDADYGDLGILVRSSGYSAIRTRVIDEDDAARAMQLVDDAGIDISTKAIWADRERIAEGVAEPSLADWIRARENSPDG